MSAINDLATQYTLPGHPIAFSSPGNIKRSKYATNSKKIMQTLNKTDSYTLHREYHKPKTRNPFYVYQKRQQIQMDLIDIRGLRRTNNNVTFLLVAIDCFTKYAWVEPMKRKTAIASLAAIKAILQKILGTNHGNETTSEKPKCIFFDKGTEFTNKLVMTFLKQEGIKTIHPSSDLKASIAERFNRTFQDLLYRHNTDKQTTRYIDALEDLLHTYNNRGHRTLKYLTPYEAEKDNNQEKVLNALMTHYGSIRRKPIKYNVGQRVRIKTLGDHFARGYHQRFSNEQFVIVSINTRMPIPMYILKSLNDNEIVKGGFYSEEIQPIDGDEFKIEKVLKKRRNNGTIEYFVKWQGFNAAHNSWITSKDITKNY